MIQYYQKERTTTPKPNNTTTWRKNFMTIKDYADVLRLAIKMQIGYIEEDGRNGRCATEYFEGYNDGIIRGLEMALEKIDASGFLMEKYS